MHVTLSGLTIRNGADPHGGGIRNRGDLSIADSTIEGNAAATILDEAGAVVTPGAGGGIYNTGQLALDHVTVSDNTAEHYGGALYSASEAAVEVDVLASTLAYNTASRIPDQWVVQITNAGLSPATLPITSGDEIRFENQTAQAHTMTVQTPPAGVICETKSGATEIVVPRIGTGLSDALVCNSTAATVDPVLVLDAEYDLTLAISITLPTYAPAGASIYQEGWSTTTLSRSIVYTTGAVDNCEEPAESPNATVRSLGDNVLRPETVYDLPGKSTCTAEIGDVLEDPMLGPLQDNNWVDYDANTLSGYTHTRALLPYSPAIDRHDESCLRCSDLSPDDRHIADERDDRGRRHLELDQHADADGRVQRRRVQRAADRADPRR